MCQRVLIFAYKEGIFLQKKINPKYTHTRGRLFEGDFFNLPKVAGLFEGGLLEVIRDVSSGNKRKKIKTEAECRRAENFLNFWQVESWFSKTNFQLWKMLKVGSAKPTFNFLKSWKLVLYKTNFQLSFWLKVKSWFWNQLSTFWKVESWFWETNLQLLIFLFTFCPLSAGYWALIRITMVGQVPNKEPIASSREGQIHNN